MGTHILKTKIPKEWIPKIKKVMEKEGIKTYDEYLRFLIREHLKEKIEVVAR